MIVVRLMSSAAPTCRQVALPAFLEEPGAKLASLLRAGARNAHSLRQGEEGPVLARGSVARPCPGCNLEAVASMTRSQPIDSRGMYLEGAV